MEILGGWREAVEVFSNGSIQLSVPVTSSLSATGNASLSVNGSTISVGANAAALSIGGNSTSAGAGCWNISTGTAVLMGGNNITLSQNGASISISAFSQTVQTQASGGIAGTATAITGNASITLNSAGLSFNGSGLAGAATAITGKALITLNNSGLSFNGTSLAGTGTSVASTTGNYSMALNSTGLTLSVPYLTRYIFPDGNALTTIGAFGNASNEHPIFGCEPASHRYASPTFCCHSPIRLQLEEELRLTIIRHTR